MSRTQTIPASRPVNPAQDAFLRTRLQASLPRMTEAQVRAALEYAQGAYPRIGDYDARSESEFVAADKEIAAATVSLLMALDGFAPVRDYNHRSTFGR